jgi:hypothetical protein
VTERKERKESDREKRECAERKESDRQKRDKKIHSERE